VIRIIQCKSIHFLKKEEGPTAVEYAVMLATIIVVCIGVVTTIGQRTNTMFSNIELNMGAS